MQIVAELWLILTLTDSGVAVGIATALQFTGILLFGALGGSLADRFDKRKLLMVTQTGMAVPATAALRPRRRAASAQAWMVFVVIGLRGLVLAVDNPARQAFVIEIVGPDRVVNAVSLNSVLVHSARITGPAIAGVIIALSGVAPCFAVNALSFAAMLFALYRMHPDKLHRPRPRPPPRQRPRGAPARRRSQRAAGAAGADAGPQHGRLQLPGGASRCSPSAASPARSPPTRC